MIYLKNVFDLIKFSSQIMVNKNCLYRVGFGDIG
jgi:hypothetical protein